MENLAKLEACYQKLIGQLHTALPDGIFQIDLAFLEAEGILYPQTTLNPFSQSSMPIDNCYPPYIDNKSSIITKSFHNNFKFNVVETQDKVTLFNDTFIIWIVPTFKQESSTLTIIAKLVQPNKDDTILNPLSSSKQQTNNNSESIISAECAFMTSGIYNSSRVVLVLLEHFIKEIQTTDNALTQLIKNSY